MPSNKPKVSTITPCFRMEKYLKKFLEEVPKQTIFEDLELVVDLNDPTENELKWCQDFKEKYPDRIKLIITSPVEPIGTSMNTCIKNASGELLTIWNVDDLRTPYSIERQVKLHEETGAEMIHGNFVIVNSFGSTHGRLLDHTPYVTGHPIVTDSMCYGPFFMFKASLLKETGLFDEQLRSAADFDLCMRLVRVANKIACVPEVLGYYLDEGKGASTRGDGLQPLERTVVELRYGLHHKIDKRFIEAAQKNYDVFNIKKSKPSEPTVPERYKKEDYVHMDEFWKQYMPKVLLNQYESYFKGRVGDFGCNTGHFDIHVAQMPGVEEVVGFDINEKAILAAKNFAKEKGVSNVSFHHQNLMNKINVDQFDFAVCFHVLEHIYPEDIDMVMRNLEALVKPGGHILVNQPDKESYAWEKSHVFHPNKEELSKLFERFGFETIESYEDERGGQTGHSRNITALFRRNS